MDEGQVRVEDKGAMVGAAERSRTPDLLITNQLLYQLSYCSTLGGGLYISGGNAQTGFIRAEFSRLNG